MNVFKHQVDKICSKKNIFQYRVQKLNKQKYHISTERTFILTDDCIQTNTASKTVKLSTILYKILFIFLTKY